MILSSTKNIVFAVLMGILAIVSDASAAVVSINFDNLPIGTSTDSHYLSVGVMFFRGNGARGTSTAIRTDTNGNPISARVDSFGTSVSLPNVLVPAVASNDDIWVHFYDPAHNNTRTSASFVQIQNDKEGFPPIFMEAFDQGGNSLGISSQLGPSEYGSLSIPGMWLVKFYGKPGVLGNLGVDNFSFEVQSSTVPEPGTMLIVLVLVGGAILPGIECGSRSYTAAEKD